MTCSGEIWTDAHGFATVVLPGEPDADLQVELQALAAGVSAALATEPTRRRFTITTNEPHVKVAWRARPRRATSPDGARKEQR